MYPGRCYFFADRAHRLAVVERPLPGGFKYWDIERADPSMELVQYVAGEAKARGAVFVRLTPELPWGHPLGPEFKELEFVYPRLMRRSHSPSATLKLDLTKSEKELLAEMHPKTRYNIRVAERHGVTVIEGDREKDFTVFWELLRETAERDGISLLMSDHYRRMLSLTHEPRVLLLLARYEERDLSGLILVVHDKISTYLHGGSTNRDRQVMASSFLQWQAIKLSKRLGCTVYDFWGIQMDDVPGAQPQEQAWSGITRFKKGFGGSEVRYLGTKDLPLRPLLYKMLSMAAWFKR